MLHSLKEISNEVLTLEDVPQDDAAPKEINLFALSFDGYKYWGSFAKCAEVAYSVWYKDLPNLTELRTALFFIQRANHHTADIDEPDYTMMRIYINKIRRLLEESHNNK